IRALMPSLATTKPFTNPTAQPAASATAAPATTLPVLAITVAAITPARAKVAPTDKSKSPEARQNSMVQLTMPMVHTASVTLMKFIAEKKLGTVSEHTSTSSASTSSMPALSITFHRVVWLVIFYPFSYEFSFASRLYRRRCLGQRQRQ